MRFPRISFLALPLLAALTGCALTADQANLADVSVSNSGMHGTVHGGQTPVGGSTITLYAAGTSGYGKGATVLATTTADSHSNWTIASYTCPTAATPTYVVASGGITGTVNNPNIVMIAGTGPCSGLTNLSIYIDEVTTAATAYSLSHFFNTTVGGAYTTDLIGGTSSAAYNKALSQADITSINTLVNLATGAAIATSTAGGVTITTEDKKLNNIANILAACVNSNGETSTTETTTYCGQLFNLTAPNGATTRPLDTLQAAVQMALYPYRNVTALYNLPPAASPFTGLATAPNDWTLGVSYSSTAFGLSIAGSATSGSSSNIDIDPSGNIWFPTNSLTAHGGAYFNPYSRSFNGPYGTSLAVPQYLAIDPNPNANIFVTDTTTPQVEAIPSGTPNGAALTTYGAAFSGNMGPIAIATSSQSGYGLVSSINSSSIYALPANVATANAVITANSVAASPTGVIGVDVEAATSKSFTASSGSSTRCVLALNQSGISPTVIAMTAANCYSGGIANTTGGSDVIMAASSLNQVCDADSSSCFAPPVPVSMPEGIATDGDGAIWIANAGNASISTMAYKYNTGKSTDFTATSPVAYIHNTANGGTLTTPYGLAVDGAGNVWVSNAGCVNTTAGSCLPTAYILSELIGAAAPTVTPLGNQAFGYIGTRPTN